MISKITSRAFTEVDKLVLGCEKKIYRTGFVAHHGIQRSGTNFLLISLMKHHLRVINRHDPERNIPSHKHFRWYEDKSILPKEIAMEYGSDIFASNVNELNMISNFPVDTKHIVIQKEESASLLSILNWGLRVKWFNSKDEAISAAARFQVDINQYYKFWDNLSKKNPTQVQLINYDLLIKNNSLLEETLRKLNFKVKPLDLSVGEVPQSPRDRKKIISFSDIEHLF